MAISAAGNFANVEPKGTNPALSYNHQRAINEQNQKTGSQLSYEKDKAAMGATLVVNLIV